MAYGHNIIKTYIDKVTTFPLQNQLKKRWTLNGMVEIEVQEDKKNIGRIEKPSNEARFVKQIQEKAKVKRD